MDACGSTLSSAVTATSTRLQVDRIMPSDHARATLQCRERVLEIGQAECEALANRNRRGSVIQSCDPELHLVTYVMNGPTCGREGDYRHSHRSGFSSPPARRDTQKYHQQADNPVHQMQR